VIGLHSQLGGNCVRDVAIYCSNSDTAHIQHTALLCARFSSTGRNDVAWLHLVPLGQPKWGGNTISDSLQSKHLTRRHSRYNRRDRYTQLLDTEKRPGHDVSISISQLVGCTRHVHSSSHLWHSCQGRDCTSMYKF